MNNHNIKPPPIEALANMQLISFYTKELKTLQAENRTYTTAWILTLPKCNELLPEVKYYGYETGATSLTPWNTFSIRGPYVILRSSLGCDYLLLNGSRAVFLRKNDHLVSKWRFCPISQAPPYQ